MLETLFGCGLPLKFVKIELCPGGESIVIMKMKTTATNASVVPLRHVHPDEACFRDVSILNSAAEWSTTSVSCTSTQLSTRTLHGQVGVSMCSSGGKVINRQKTARLDLPRMMEVMKGFLFTTTTSPVITTQASQHSGVNKTPTLWLDPLQVRTRVCSKTRRFHHRPSSWTISSTSPRRLEPI